MKTFSIDPMVCAMSRLIHNGDVVTTGVASVLPMLAVGLAKATHAPELTYFNCVGAVDPHWEELPHSSVEPALLPADAFIRLEEIWEMANQGRIDLMFFGAFQIDALGRTNLHRLPSGLKLPGIAGASTMRRKVKRSILFSTRHDRRTFVPKVDVVTTSPRPGEQALTVTPRSILSLGPAGARIEALVSGNNLDAIQSSTGFELTWTNPMETVPPPTSKEQKALHFLDPKGLRERFL
jgi:glutaconate CoA-transferase subunit B